MKARALLTLLLSLFTWICPVLAVEEEANQAEPTLADIATAKRGAMILLSAKLPHPLPGEPAHGYGLGVFISADGLALVNLSSLAVADKPEIFTVDWKKLPMGTILGIFPTPELALVKFNHKPKEWLPLAPKEPEVGERIAIVGLFNFKSPNEKFPPVLGPVMAKRSTYGSNLREPGFRRIMSLGAGMSTAQRLALNQGSYVVDGKGQLVAVKAGLQTMGTAATGTQMLILLAPLAELAEPVKALVKDAKAIPFPLPPASNPIEIALMDPSFGRWDMAYQERNPEAAMKHLAELRKRYPDSKRIQEMSYDPLVTAEGKELKDLAELPRLEASAPAVAQLERMRRRAEFLAIRMKDLDGAIAELTAALPLCPQDFSEIYRWIALYQAQAGRAELAEALYLKVHAMEPENISLASLLEMKLVAKGRHEEAKKFTDQVYELESLYRAK